MNNPAVSIIVPVFNTSQYVEKCVESLRNQTLQDLEIVLVNDGSTDGSNALLEQLSSQDKRITYLNLENNVGTFHARLAGIRAARGEFIGTVDSDDWVAETMYQKLYEEATKRNCDIVECRLWAVEDSGRLKKLNWSDHSVKESMDQEIFRKVLNRDIWHIAANKIFRSALFERSFWFYEQVKEKIVVADDKLLTAPLFLYAKKYRSLTDRFYYYVQRESSSSNNRSFEHDIRHIKDTHAVDFYIKQLILQDSNESDLLELLDKNEKSEIDLCLNNIACYPVGSLPRKELYDVLSNQYGGRLLSLLFGKTRINPETGEFILEKKGGLENFIAHLRYCEKYFYVLLKSHYPFFYVLYFPFHWLLMTFYKLMKIIRP